MVCCRALAGEFKAGGFTGSLEQALELAEWCSQNEIDLIVLEERLHAIWTELDDVAGAVWISHEVRLNA